MNDEAARTLLDRLSSGRADAAWSEFLREYSPLVMHVVRRFAAGEDGATDCFLHVCSALSDGGFRRLRSYRPDGPARFRTWLAVVVANLCRDWDRGRRGRTRPSRSIERLPELERQVYHCLYERGMSRAQCLRVLLPGFPDLTAPRVAEINGRLFGLLTPRQRWRLSIRRPRVPARLADSEDDSDDPLSRLEEPGAGPEELATRAQDCARLQDALAQLTAEQRLLLRLRFEQELTLAEIARLTRQPDPFRVNRQIDAALKALAGLMVADSAESDRKSR